MSTITAAFVKDGVRVGEVRAFSWNEFRQLCRQGRKLIVVDGSILDVEELQDREHKGGAVYSIGTDMTAMFAGTHGNVLDRKSAHRDGADGKPALTVMQNIMEKVRTYTIGHLEGRAGVELQDPAHRFWVPGRPKPAYDEAVGSSMAAEGVDPEQLVAEALRGIAPASPEARALAAVVGSLVADAAAQPTHWNYAAKGYHEKLRQMERWGEPEFLRPSINTFYRVPTGTNTCYGDQAFLILQSLVSQGGCDPRDIHRRFVDGFREGGSLEHYTGPLDRGTPTAGDFPLDGGWRHGSVIQFLRNAELGKDWSQCGANDAQADCLVKIIPVVALYAGTDELLGKVEAAIRVTQNNDKAVAFGLAAARLVADCILGAVPGAALRGLMAVLQGDGDSGVSAELSKTLTPARRDMAYMEGVMDACGGRPMPGLA